MSERKLKIIIDQSGDAGPGLLSLKGGLASLGGVAAGVATAGLAVAGAGVLALGAGLFTSVDAAMEAQQGQAELQAVLESTKGVAGVTADAVNDLASEFQGLTMFEDDAILKGENMLLTFTNIGKDVFPMATESMLNLAQKFGSMDQASVMLGKALNDPVAGVSALRRVGIQLTEAQEESIKKFVEMGDVASAQKVILAEVETQVGGLAEAAGATLPGRLAILKNTFSDIQETIGAAFLPILSQVADKLSSGLKSEVVQAALQSVTNFIETSVVPTVERMGLVWNRFSAGVEEKLGPAIAKIEMALSRIAIAFGITVPNIDGSKVAVDLFRDALMGIVGLIEGTGNAALTLANFIDDVRLAAEPALQIFREWSSHLSETTGPAMVLIRDALDRIAIATGGATGKFSISKILLGALKLTLDAVTIAIKLAAIGFQMAASTIEDISRAVTIAKNLGSQLGQIYTGVMSSIKSAAGSAKSAIKSLASAIQDAASSIPDWLIPGSPTPFEVGIRGIASAAGAVAGTLPQAFAGVGAGGQGSGVGGLAGGGGAGPQITIQYSPMVSTASQIELEQNLIPLIVGALRKAGVSVG